jgi:hypothetical protein
MVQSVASEKTPATPLGIDAETLRLVAQCLNHYATPGSRFQKVHGPNFDKEIMIDISHGLPKSLQTNPRAASTIRIHSSPIMLPPHEEEWGVFTDNVCALTKWDPLQPSVSR